MSIEPFKLEDENLFGKRLSMDMALDELSKYGLISTLKSDHANDMIFINGVDVRIINIIEAKISSDHIHTVKITDQYSNYSHVKVNALSDCIKLNYLINRLINWYVKYGIKNNGVEFDKHSIKSILGNMSLMFLIDRDISDDYKTITLKINEEVVDINDITGFYLSQSDNSEVTLTTMYKTIPINCPDKNAESLLRSLRDVIVWRNVVSEELEESIIYRIDPEILKTDENEMDLEKAKEILEAVGITIKGKLLCCNGDNCMNIPINNISMTTIDISYGIDITFYMKTRRDITYDTPENHGYSEEELNTAVGIIISTF